jgi:acyl transferase domain-containing protein/thioesterase domain-containing protein/acyl carrier protein
MSEQVSDAMTGKIAVVGMSCRYPGANDVAQFWENLVQGRESIRFSTDAELLQAGVSREMLARSNFVPAWGAIEETYMFDAAFFGYVPKEAELLDPQQRIFLECCWEALENAGYDPARYSGRIGVFAGTGLPRYLFEALSHPDLLQRVNSRALVYGNHHDFLATRVGYKFNLRGPCVTVQTACSTSLVSIVLACQNLLMFQSDIVLAGGVEVAAQERTGYVAEEGDINSFDGHCRAFDAAATGTVGASGAGVVVLRRLEDAVAAGDTISAIVLGYGLNNDGALRAGFTAPGVEGQVAVISDALAMAGINPETIQFVECHGTGTPIGDPIEITALTKAFRSYTAKESYCMVGSVKTNIGHAGVAAGVAGFTKAVLALKHKMVPPTLHFQKPNPAAPFQGSPFYVSAELTRWPAAETPKRAAVTSLGMGGTNAHVVLEEAPGLPPSRNSNQWQLLAWSAKSESAADHIRRRLLKHIQSSPNDSLTDIAYTLQVGRQAFQHRRAVACRGREDAIHALQQTSPRRLLAGSRQKQVRKIAFLFPGQGAQFSGMGKGLYDTEAEFRRWVDASAEILKPALGQDLRSLLYSSSAQSNSPLQLDETKYAQPALFVIEYALARLWMKWGIQPGAMLGHSIGEYVAACLAGVFSFEQALHLVAARGQIMQLQPRGSMIAVPLSESQVRHLLKESSGLSIAAVNAPTFCVLSGPDNRIEEFQEVLQSAGTSCRRLRTSHAFHSEMMRPAAEAYRAKFARLALNPPRIPYLSNLTGGWISAAEATDPEYWLQHMLQPVRFSQGVGELLKDSCIMVEVGPGQQLKRLVDVQKPAGAAHGVISCLPSADDQSFSDTESLLRAAGQLWCNGAEVDWEAMHAHESPRRIPLPTYPFEKSLYRLTSQNHAGQLPADRLGSRKKIRDWFLVPSWQRTAKPVPEARRERHSWVVLLDECGLGAEFVNQLLAQGEEVVSVSPGPEFERIDSHRFIINLDKREDCERLVSEVDRHKDGILKLLDFCSIAPLGRQSSLEQVLMKSFYGPIHLGTAFASQMSATRIHLWTVCNDLHDVTGDKVFAPERAVLTGPCKAFPREYPNVSSCAVDVQLPSDREELKRLAAQLIAEFQAPSTDELIAYRGGYRWAQNFVSMTIPDSYQNSSRLRPQGVYLITGGLGGLGLTFARLLAQRCKASLCLVGRSDFPAREDWPRWIETHGNESRISRKINEVRALEALGSHVMVVSADVSDENEMSAVISKIVARFGALHGVIHAAGLSGGRILESMDRLSAGPVLNAKVAGTLILNKVLGPFHLDFFVLCSSLTAIVGAQAQADYIAANSFLDAFAHATKNAANAPLSMNWCGWHDVGMRAESAVTNPAARGQSGASAPGALLQDDSHAITPMEGCDVLLRALSSAPGPQIAISPIDLEVRIAQSMPRQVEIADRTTKEAGPGGGHDRPNLQTVYAPPFNETESRIAAILAEALGITAVGRDDAFTDLGVHSLLALQIVTGLRTAFNVKLKVADLYDHPTVADLGRHISELFNSGQNGKPVPYAGFKSTEASSGSAAAQVNSDSTLSLVQLRMTRSDAPPLHLIHPIGGDIQAYRELVKFLPEDQPVLALQNLDLAIGGRRYSMLEEMAADYVHAIRFGQPHGPYCISGWSMGAVLAFEMAAQLKLQGEEVRLLAMIDPPVCARPQSETDHQFNTEALLMMAAVMVLGRGKEMLSMREDLNRLERQEQLKFVLRQLQHSQVLSANFSEETFSCAAASFANNLRILHGYCPKSQGGPVLFLKAAQSPSRADGSIAFAESEVWWKQFFKGPFVLQKVPGTHLTMMEGNNLRIVAEILQGHLYDVDVRSRTAAVTSQACNLQVFPHKESEYDKSV